MTTPTAPDEHELHAYVDGRLAPERERAIEAWLATADAVRADEIRAWRRDAQQLRAGLDTPELADNTALDPRRIRARRQARTRLQLAVAAALVVCTGAGGLGGWQLRARHDKFVPDMTDALEAHRMFATDGAALKLDVVPRDAGDMQAWMDQHVTGAPRLPDLGTAGYRPVGGRLFVTELGPAAVVVYRDDHGGAISFYVRPGVPQFPLPRGEHRDGPLLAQFGPVDRYWVAMVSNADGRDAAIVHGALPSR